MKKLIHLLACWAIVTSLIAQPASAADKKQIVVLLPSSDNPFWIEVRRGVDEAATKYKDRISVQTMASGDLDAATQVDQLRNVLDRRSAQAVVLGVASSTAPAAILAAFNKAKIPVVLIDTKLDPDAARQTGATWDAFIGSDNKSGGEQAALAMAKTLGSDKKVLLIKGSFVHQSAIDRAEGFLAGAKGKFDVIERDGDWSRQKATELTNGVLSRGPVGGIFASNDDMALGAIGAIKNLKLTGASAPKVIGFDATQAGVAAISAGDMYASIKQDASGMGSAGVSTALDLLDGKMPASRDTLIPVSVYPNDRAGQN